MKIRQQELKIQAKRRGFYLITAEIENSLRVILKEFKVGIAHLHLKHTSASIMLNENADPTVREDFEDFISHLIPSDFNYEHKQEGSDDMPAHIKSSIFGASLSVPVTDGRLNLGLWQGIYLNEHRDFGSSREIVITIIGE